MSAFSHENTRAQMTDARPSTPAPNAPKQPPLHAQLYRKKLTAHELLTLQAMLEHCSDGTTIRAALPRISAYSKLSVRTVQRVIHGSGERRKGKREKPGLTARGVLVELAPANAEKRRPACYRFNLDALHDCPRVARYLRGDQLRFDWRATAHKPGTAATHEPPIGAPDMELVAALHARDVRLRQLHELQVAHAHELLKAPTTRGTDVADAAEFLRSGRGPLNRWKPEGWQLDPVTP